MRYDPINWEHVHRTQEGNPQRHENEQVQYWTEQLRDIKQKLYNLNHVSLTEPEYCTLHERYSIQRQRVEQYIRQYE